MNNTKNPGDVFKRIGKEPLVVASVGKGGIKKVLADAEKAQLVGADIIEVRVDSLPKTIFKHTSLPDFFRRLKKSITIPVIGTLRSAREQDGRKKLGITEENRLVIIKSILPFIEMADIELSADKINGRVVALAHKLKKKVILSYHNYGYTPANGKLKALSAKARKLSGDILKIAVFPKRDSDLGRLLEFSAACGWKNKVFIALGGSGLISRVAGFTFGSCLTYGHMGRSMAPGQVSIRELKGMLEFFYPQKKKQY